MIKSKGKNRMTKYKIGVEEEEREGYLYSYFTELLKMDFKKRFNAYYLKLHG